MDTQGIMTEGAVRLRSRPVPVARIVRAEYLWPIPLRGRKRREEYTVEGSPWTHTGRKRVWIG